MISTIIFFGIIATLMYFWANGKKEYAEYFFLILIAFLVSMILLVPIVCIFCKIMISDRRKKQI